jgi:NADH-quinone oxidoreductase subunit A
MLYLFDFDYFYENWVKFLLWLTSVFFIGLLLFIIFYFLILKPYDYEKVSAYECGFNPFEDVYGRFDVKYYLVAILFIIFDLEVIFLYPWVIGFSFVSFFGFWVILFFLLILFLGFIYEWKRGSLEW